MTRLLWRLACLGGVAALAAALPGAGPGQRASRMGRPAQAIPAQARALQVPALPLGVVAQSQGPLYGALYGVSFTSPANGWAVGFGCVPNCGSGMEKTLIMHWNGAGWNRVHSPDLSPVEGLVAVSAASAKDAWAVGGYFTSSGYFHTLILRWNGRRWSRVHSPDPSPDRRSGLTFLGGVTAVSARSAWAVGDYCVKRCQLDGEIDRTLVLHWDGIRWSRVASPSPGATYSALNGVSGLSTTSAWAAGAYEDKAGHLHPLILHWNGARWSRTAAGPGSGTSFRALTGVTAVSGRDAWAVGYSCTSKCTQYAYPDQTDRTLILHWNGARWSRVASPSPGPSFSILSGVSGVSGRDAWAVGHYLASGRHLRTLTLRWDGARWSRVASPNPGAGGDVLSMVSAVSAVRAEAVGGTCHEPLCSGPPLRPVILRWNGRSWSAMWQQQGPGHVSGPGPRRGLSGPAGGRRAAR